MKPYQSGTLFSKIENKGRTKGDLLLLRNCVVHVFFVRKVILIIYKYCVDVAFEGHTLKAEKANMSPTCVF